MNTTTPEATTDTLAIDYAGYSGDKWHLIRNGKALCGTKVTRRINSTSPKHANCQRCIAKNGGVTTWPAMQAAMDADLAAAEAAAEIAYDEEAEARVVFEAAQARYTEVARRAGAAKNRVRQASKIARNSRWAV